MGDHAPQDDSPWHQGRNPDRRRIGALGWALLVAVLLVLFLFAPR
ncbi:hypothetical protein [Streptomyces sp. NPDC005805]